MAQIKYALDEIMKICDVSLSEDIDYQLSNQVRLETNGTMPNYFRIKHNINKADLFLIESVHFDYGFRTSSPVKTLAVFAHFQEFSYS